MHDEACAQRVTGDAVERRLEEEVHRTRRLTEGARAAGAQVHNLPKSPADLGDNGEFRYAVLGPEAASESGRPSAAASDSSPKPRDRTSPGCIATWWCWRCPRAMGSPPRAR